jgi:hypothetical protein
MAARLPSLWVALGVPLAPSSKHRLLAVAACGDFNNSGRLLLPSRGDLSTIDPPPPLLSGSGQLLTYSLVVGVRTLQRYLPISFPSYSLPIVLHWRVPPLWCLFCYVWSECGGEVGRASISIVSPQRAGVKNISMSNKVYYVTIQYICIILWVNTTDINN